MTPLLDAEADAIYGDDAQIIKDEIAKLTGENDPVSLNQTLMAKLPLFKAVLSDIKNTLNVLPPSGGMAGVISMVDTNVGVFQSPKAMGPKSTVNLTSKDQEDLNLPLTGKAINNCSPGRSFGMGWNWMETAKIGDI